MSKYHTIPECGWPCRLNEETSLGIELNDGTCVVLEKEGNYVWYDINGGVMETFAPGTTDFEAWEEVRKKLTDIELREKPPVIVP